MIYTKTAVQYSQTFLIKKSIILLLHRLQKLSDTQILMNKKQFDFNSTAIASPRQLRANYQLDYVRFHGYYEEN